MESILTRTVLFVILLLPASFNIHAESPLQSLSRYLADTKFSGELRLWKPDEKLLNFEQGLQCYTANHNYLWYKNRLTIQLDGSGRVFQLTNADTVERIDNTCYEGYNFDAFNFVYRDTLFSIGGYGFWQFNGHLRFFNEQTGEWALLSTNKNIPVRMRYFSQIFLDKANHRLYVTYVDPGTVLSSNTPVNANNLFVQCLDLKSKQWWEQPRSFSFKEIQPTYWLVSMSIDIPLGQGALMISEKDAFVINYAANRVFKLEPSIFQKIHGIIGTLTNWLIIPEKNRLIFFNPENGVMNPVDFTDANMIPLPGSLFEEKSVMATKDSFSAMSFYLTSAFYSIVVFFMAYHILSLRKRMKRGIQAVRNGEGPLPSVKENIEVARPAFRDNLTELERTVLDLLIANSLKDQYTPLTDINHALGLSKKTTQVQNNIRASTLLMINKKFKIFSGINDELIQKERTTLDKRIFEYFIPKKYLSKLK